MISQLPPINKLALSTNLGTPPVNFLLSKGKIICSLFFCNFYPFAIGMTLNLPILHVLPP